MYVKIHGNKDYVKGNTQSCRDLIHYLEKENDDRLFEEQEQFFNHTLSNINAEFAINSIDSNRKGLKDKDAKFFMVTVNPSERELKHLARIATNRRDISDISEMKPGELERYNNLVKGYTRAVMEEYAKAFNRDLTGADLVYYAKLEQQRHYKGTDAEVKEGFSRSGEKKEGLQTHVHIVVSRKDVSQKISLSPLANSRGSSKHVLNGKSVKVGFNRDEFVAKCEGEFDKRFQFRREYENSYGYYKFSSNPMAGLQKASRIAQQAIERPDIAGKNLVVSAFDNATKTRLASGMDKVSNLTSNPDAAKDLLVSKLDQLVSQLLPPETKAAKKIAEKIIKPIIDLGSGGLDI
jgi:hypothetical protein